MTTKTHKYGKCKVCGNTLTKNDIDIRIRQHGPKDYCISCIKKYKMVNKLNNKYKIINNDCVEEMNKMKGSSVDLKYYNLYQ